MSNQQQQGNLKQALVAGACAGTAVDTALFPLGNFDIVSAQFTQHLD